MVDQRWTRWIKGSILKYFQDNKASYNLVLNPQDIKDLTSWVELKIIGPRFKEQIQDQWHVELEIHLMCSILATDNIYSMADMVGYFQSLMVDIPVYEIRDSNELFGCLSLRQDVARPIDTIPWGQANPSNNSEMTSIDGFYKMEIH